MIYQEVYRVWKTATGAHVNEYKNMQEAADYLAHGSIDKLHYWLKDRGYSADYVSKRAQ